MKPFPFLLCLLVLTLSVQAQLPAARLFTIFPPGAAAGATQEVSVTGADLDAPTELRFSHAGIGAKPKLAPATGEPEPNQFIVRVAAAVPPGAYEARFVGRFGVSNARVFMVSSLPETIETGSNHSPTNAMAVPLGTVINGHSETNAVDYFRFPVRSGERLTIECQAQTLDSRMDPALVLYDGGGREIATARQGGVLDFTATGDGQCVVKVHDFLYRGGPEFFYRLLIGAGPYLDYVFPPSAVPGTKGKFSLFGRNFPGSTKEPPHDGRTWERLEVEIEVPAATVAGQSAPVSPLLQPAAFAVDGFEYRLQTPRGWSNPVFLSFATAPVVREASPNEHPATAQKLSPPCEVAGQLHPAGDQDWYTFEAKKGAVYWIEVFSHRLGLPTDPFVLVQRVAKNDHGDEQLTDLMELSDTDTNPGGVEFNIATRDPAGRFEAPADGTYRILVRDLFNRNQSDPRHVYRLCLRTELPDFRLVVMPVAPPPANKEAKVASVWTQILRRGETIPVKVIALRHDNFSGEIALSLEGLPPGVTASDSKIESGQTATILLLTAAESATTWVGPLKVIGRAKLGETELVRVARGAGVIWTVPDHNNEPVTSRSTRDVLLALCGAEAAPVSVESAEKKVWEVPVGGKLSLPLRITRRAEFKTNLTLKATGVPALNAWKELEVDGKATNTTAELDLAQTKLPPGTHTFHFKTETTGKYRNDPEGAQAAEEVAKQAEREVANLHTAARKAANHLPAAREAAIQAASAVQQAAGALAAAIRAEAETIALAQSEADTDQAEASSAAATAVAKTIAAAEARRSAEQAAVAANARAKAAANALVETEKAIAEAPARIKAAAARQAATAERARQAVERAQPRDMTLTVYSAPITVKVIEVTKK